MDHIGSFILLIVKTTDSFKGIYGLVQLFDRLGYRRPMRQQIDALLEMRYISVHKDTHGNEIFEITEKGRSYLNNINQGRLFTELESDFSNRSLLGKLKYQYRGI